MADNIVLNPGSGGATIKTDDDGTAHWQYVKVAFGPDNTQTRVTTSAGLPTDVLDRATRDCGKIDIAGFDVSLPAGTNNIGDVDVLTLPSIPAGNNNIGDVDVVSFPSTAHSADFDTGAGTDTKNAFGIIVPASGGAAVVPGDTTNGLDVDVTRVQGTVTVDSELPAAAALADGASNPTTPTVGAANLAFNGSTWDRVRGDTTNGLDVDVTRVQGTVTVDSELPAAAALADATSNPTVPTVGAAPLMYNGSTWDRVRGDTTNGVDVDVTRVQGTVTVGTHDVGSITTAVTPGTGASNLGKAEDAVHASGDVGVVALGVRRDTPTSGVSADGDYATLNVNSSGRLYTSATIDSALPTGSNTIGNVGVTSVTPGTSASNLGKAEDAAHATGDVGVMALGVRNDTPAALSGTNGDYEPLQVNAHGGLWVTPTPGTTGGLSIFRSLNLNTTDVDVKTSAGLLYGWYIFNNATSVRYVKFYNDTAANVTVGTTTPVMTIPIPAASSGGVAANVMGAHGIAFSTAICVAATTGIADTDTGNPSTNDVVVNLWYK